MMQETNLDSIQQPIKGFMQERFPALKSTDLDSATSLLDGDAIDSMGLLELVAYLEETFDITFDDDDLNPENFDSVERLTQLVLEKRDG
ncbi:MAG: acyl carrier protein [Alphaproteobacteria bacterium GM202ARS2]|nr:acyl carrier protein [Alphaproteobacteria bacterium GM202ARS2]